ncbi:MAG: cupin [Solirubrobacteraceae bacterium]|jgi:mannose-6-phosphate isomerase
MIPTLTQPKHVDKPWGHELWYAHTESYAGKVLHVIKGHRLSLQYHERKDETCYLIDGSVRLIQGATVDELSERTLLAGHAWRNVPGVVHTIEALETATILEVSTPELDDVVRLRDRYGRDGTSAP